MGDPELLSTERMRQTARSCGWTLEELAGRYLKAARKDLDALRAALAANRIQEAGRIAHGLAGASEMAGVPGMGTLLRRLEQAAGAGDAAAARALGEQAEARFAEVRGMLGEGAR